MTALAARGMLAAPYTFVFTARAARALYSLTKEQLAALAPRSVFMATDRGVPTQDLSDALTANQLLRLEAPYGIFVGVLELSHIMLGAADRQLNTFGFGFDRSRTAAALVQGFSSMTLTDPLKGLLPNVVVFNNRVAGALQYFAAVGPDGNVATFAAVLADGNIAIFRSAVLDFVDVPEAQDYARLLKGATGSSSSNASDNSASLWWIALVLVALAACGAVCIWRLRRKRSAALLKSKSPPLIGTQLHGRPVVGLPRLDRSALHLRKTLRVGSFGQVYTASCKTPISGMPVEEDATFVIKLWQILGSDDGAGSSHDLAARENILEELELEAQILRQFHGEPHIAEVYGLVVNDSGRSIGMAMESFTLGTLAELLVRQTQLNGTKLRMAHEIAAGMRAVSAVGGLHMELAACHVLLTADKRCKLVHIGNLIE